MGYWRAASRVCSVILMLALGCGDSGNKKKDDSGRGDGGSGADASMSGGDGDGDGDGDAGTGTMDGGGDGDGDGDGDAGAMMDGGGDGDGDGGGDAGTDGGNTQDTQSTPCSALPVTITLGETIQVNTTGAVLCVNLASDQCRLTTNTYSDGVNPCPEEDTVAVFMSGATNVLSVPGYMGSWRIVWISHGTLDPQWVSSLPTGEPVTASLKPSDDGPEYALNFQFNGDNTFTLNTFKTPD